MNKKKLHVILESNEEKYDFISIGELNNNTISYTEKKEIVTKVEYDINKNTLYRDNINLEMQFLFNDKKAKIKIKEMNKELDLILEDVKVLNEENKISIEYKIEDIDYKYIIEY